MSVSQHVRLYIDAGAYRVTETRADQALVSKDLVNSGNPYLKSSHQYSILIIQEGTCIPRDRETPSGHSLTLPWRLVQPEA